MPPQGKDRDDPIEVQDGPTAHPPQTVDEVLALNHSDVTDASTAAFDAALTHRLHVDRLQPPTRGHLCGVLTPIGRSSMLAVWAGQRRDRTTVRRARLLCVVGTDMAGRLKLSDYLEIQPAAATRQWHMILARTTPGPGQHQEDFLPVETLLCAAAMYVVDGHRYGSSTAAHAPTPVPELARLFERPPTSITAKMANLEGTWEHGARLDRLVGSELSDDLEHLSEIYRVLLATARAAGIGSPSLPDFLHLEEGGSFYLLGQDELAEPGAQSAIVRDLEARLAIDPSLSELATERLVLGAVRVGQHRFATDVLHNCGGTCVFCGFVVREAPPSGLLRASHVKPWRDSSHKERLDVANGLAACPTHDAAFDTGLLTVADDLTIVQSTRLLAARAQSPAVERYFGVPPLHPKIRLPAAATVLDKSYLDWHQAKVFVD